MMLLFLVEEQVFTFFHDFKEVNIDLDLDVFTSISCLSIDQQYTIEGGASGNCTVRRVAYTIEGDFCIVGDRVFKVMSNGDVDFERQIFVCHTLIYSSGEECFTRNVYVKMGESFDLFEHLDGYSGVTRLDHYDDERYYVRELAMDVWRGE